MSQVPIDNHILYQSLGALPHTQPSKWTKRWLNFGDTLLSLLVISPLVIAHWRGTWEYMNHHPKHFPAWNCFILGSILHSCMAILREPLISKYNVPSNGKTSFIKKINRFFVTKIYTYVFSIGCIMHWRGGWDIMVVYLGNKIELHKNW